MERENPMIVWKSAASIVGLAGAVLVGPAAPDQVQMASVVGVSAAAVVPDPYFEARFVPISPCRIVDTRGGTGVNQGPIAASQTRNFAVTNAALIAGQGGKAGGCGILPGAGSIAAVVTAVSPVHAGYLRAWPGGQAEPAATVLNYATFSTGTGVTLSINSDATTELSVKNYGGPTQLVIDVTGYYTKPLRAWVYQDGSVYSPVSSRLVSVNAVELGVYDVTFDRDISTCTPLASVNHSEC